MRMTVLLVAAALLSGCTSSRTATPSGESAPPSPSPSPSSPSASPSAPIDEPPVPTIRLKRVVTGMTAPVSMINPPGDRARTLVVDQVGLVRELDRDGLVDGTPFLDLRDEIVPLSRSRDDERGLLGVAFSPAFATDRRVAVFRTVPTDRRNHSHTNVLSIFRTDPSGSVVDRTSEQVVWSRPQRGTSHSAGQIVFQQADRLLLLVGDASDERLVQDPRSPFGKVLRFDLGMPGSAPEQVASGMRHPWRTSYDARSRSWLFAEPNFTSQYQEVNQLRLGANYGWGAAPPEARACWPAGSSKPARHCVRGPKRSQLRPPIAEYGPSYGLIVTGAHVYRGRHAGLRDHLVVSEWGVTNLGKVAGGKLLVSARPVGRTVRPPYELVPATTTADTDPGLFWSLMRDAHGELYVGTMADRVPRPGDGAVYKVVSGTAGASTPHERK